MNALSDQVALDEIAALLGLWNTDPETIPAGEVLASISDYVAQTGRSAETPEGA